MIKFKTEAEIARQEKFDADVYGSSRSLFEHLFRMFREAVENGDTEKANEYQTTLLENYNSTSEGCQRLMGRVRRLENPIEEPVDA